MTIRSAIRLERAKLRTQEKAAEDRLHGIRQKIEALDAAESALAGETTPSVNGDKPKRTRTYKGRKSKAERKNETLDALREVEPRLLADEGRSAGDLAADFGIPHASAANAIAELLDEGKVRKVGETPRGNPIVRYKPTKVRPGEEVTA